MKPPIKGVPAEVNRRLDDLENKASGEVLIEVIKSIVPGGSRSSPGAAIPPPTVSVASTGEDSISLSATPTDEDLYEFALRKLGFEGWNTLVTTGSEATFISLKSGTQYEAKVRLLNTGGSVGNWSSVIVAVTADDVTPPPIPTNLSLASDSFYIRAVVDEISIKDHPDLAGYEFHASLTTGYTPDSTTLKQVGISNRCIIHVSSAGQTWYIRARSLDTSRNYSEYCDEVSVLVPNTKIPTVPSDPTSEGDIVIAEGTIVIDNCDTIGNWESEESEAIRISAADGIDVAEGTGAIKVEIDKYGRKINQASGTNLKILGQYTANQFAGQRFQATWTGNCKRISIPMYAVGSPGAATLIMYDDSAGNPDITHSLGSATLTAPAQTAWYTATFAGAGIALVSGTNYWFVVESVVNSTNYYKVLYDSDDPYGGSAYMMGWGSSNTLPIRPIGWDLVFRIFDDSDCTGKHFKISALAAKDLSPHDTIEVYVKQKQTITNGVFKISMGEAALGEQLHTITTPSGDYNPEVWDITGIAAGDRDAIDNFGIEVDVADDYTLSLYFDYFRAVVPKSVKVKFSDEVAQIYPAINPGPGEGHQIIFPWLYDTVGQGTWALGYNTSFVFAVYFHNTGVDGDNLTFKTYLAAGTYTVKIQGYRWTDRGIIDIQVDGVAVAQFDQYGAGTNMVWTDTGNVIANSGVKTITMMVNGKNASSSSYICCVNTINFYRTG